MNFYKRVGLCVGTILFVIITTSVNLALDIRDNNKIKDKENVIELEFIKDDFTVLHPVMIEQVNNTLLPIEIKEVDMSEDIHEQEKIEAALIEQGYLREDVPLSYDLQDSLHTACEEFGVNYELVLGLIQAESNFTETVVSSVGCYGLMQLNPNYFPSNLNSHDNIRTGVEYLGKLLIKYDNNVSAALRAYNRGYDDGMRDYSNTVINYARSWGYVG